jgi:hypothetical protein
MSKHEHKTGFGQTPARRKRRDGRGSGIDGVLTFQERDHVYETSLPAFTLPRLDDHSVLGL